MARLNPEISARLLESADSLRQNLAREVVRLELGRSLETFHEIFNEVYLPRLTTLGQDADFFLAFEDWQMFCQPLQLDLAPTQLHVLIKRLEFLILILNPLQP